MFTLVVIGVAVSVVVMYVRHDRVMRRKRLAESAPPPPPVPPAEPGRRDPP